MNATVKKEASTLMVVVAFTTVYLVWGSTYFFIQKAIQDIPPFIMGALRFFTAGLLLMIWCIYKKEKIWSLKQFKVAAVSGILLLFVGNGAVIWAEQSLPSSLVAVLVSAAPLWFVLLDKPKWKENFTNRSTVIGLIVGFAGVILLFSERVAGALSASGGKAQIAGLVMLIVGSACWAGGSLFSKYKGSGSAIVNTMWQLIAAGIVFFISSFAGNEWKGFHWQQVSGVAWLSLIFLITLGSLAAYSAYVWLLQVRPATQVSTYAYVNPVVAVLLGILFAGEHMSLLQLAGLTVILISVLLINLAKKRKEKQHQVLNKRSQAKAA
jgi:drug/metabolite transporter (DMT)-like permease